VHRHPGRGARRQRQAGHRRRGDGDSDGAARRRGAQPESHVQAEAQAARAARQDLPGAHLRRRRGDGRGVPRPGPVHPAQRERGSGYAAAVAGVKAGSAVGGTERKHLLAAFNGGFKLGVGAGGYEQEGHVISPLLKGDASLIIDRSGRARIGVWGSGAPGRGEAVYSVRQNLQPLVEHGKPTQAAYNWYAWGATLGGGELVARSALGEDQAGDLLYAGSMSASPADMAQALAGHGARIAMELDINPEWVQLDVASRPGGSLRAEVPGQYRPANQFIDGWSRDFITVLAG